MENKRDVVVVVYYRCPSQDVSTDELFYRQLGEDNFLSQVLSEPTKKDDALDLCPGLPRIGLSFPSSGGEL